jgi:hypothetical protein
MKKIKIISIVVISLVWFACDSGENTVDLGDQPTCEGCHTSKSTLQLYASTETSGGTGGG